jgi:CRISPR-associated endonuclease/helicase Cas3
MDGELRELMLHLIASHHGRARPFMPAKDRQVPCKGKDEQEFPAELEQDALDAALRYIRLQRRWGPWVLAWLEAVFCSVDWTVSRRHEGEDDPTATRPIPAEEAAE